MIFLHFFYNLYNKYIFYFNSLINVQRTLTNKNLNIKCVLPLGNQNGQDLMHLYQIINWIIKRLILKCHYFSLITLMMTLPPHAKELSINFFFFFLFFAAINFLCECVWFNVDNYIWFLIIFFELILSKKYF